LSADDHPFHQELRIAFHQVAVDERTRVALICIADQVFRLTLGVIQKFPLQTRRERRAAAAPEPGFLYFVDHFHGLQPQRTN